MPIILCRNSILPVTVLLSERDVNALRSFAAHVKGLSAAFVENPDAAIAVDVLGRLLLEGESAFVHNQSPPKAYGVGNVYARYGQVRSWLSEQDEIDRGR